MFHRLSTKIVLYLSEQGAVKQENVDWCIYALENKISSFSFTLIIFLSTLPFASTYNSLILMVSIIAIRRYSGGYHCKSELRCFFLSLSSVLLGLSMASFLSSTSCVIACIFMLLISYIVLYLAPINLPEIHLSESEMRKNRYRLRISSTMLLLIYMVLSYYEFQISAYGIVGFSIAALSVIAAKMTHIRRNLS